MHGLQTIKRTNEYAIKAYLGNAEEGAHLVKAPTDERFDHNIPWHFESNVLHVHLHDNTKATDLMKLKALVAAEVGPSFATKWHRYE